MLLMLLLALVAKDVEGSSDHPLLTRMPDSTIAKFEQKDFDSFDASAYLSGPDAKWEGRTTRITYAFPDGAKHPTMVQIARNYEAALKKIGAKVLYSDGRVVLAKAKTTWVQAAAFNDGAEYELVIVEAAPMQQEVAADADALGKGLAAEGRVAIYGIYFDTGKSAVKPESAKALEEIVKLLQQNPGLRLFVVGHTDSAGQQESNLKLSRDRAAAVVKDLIARGVDGKRLEAAGVGPWSPVATNRTEEGKAKNRRVELVER